jgi:hypothetical protein
MPNAERPGRQVAGAVQVLPDEPVCRWACRNQTFTGRFTRFWL